MQTDLRRLAFSNSTIVLKACDHYMSKNTKKGTAVTYARTLTCDEDLEIMADEDNMKQCVMNLLSNANKFTSKGSITLSGDIAIESKLRRTLLLKLVVTG